jgi:GWxTD domain-containing protein
MEDIISFIDYFASQKEMNTLKSLSGEGKRVFLKRFWRRFDPDPETPQNEFLRDFIDRVKYADTEFSTAFKKGRYTDRGRIYIKYGPPDAIKKESVSWGKKDRERWTYYSQGGLEFIFVDIEGTGDYRLVWTNAKDEPVDPNWRQYIDPSTIEFEEEEW